MSTIDGEQAEPKASYILLPGSLVIVVEIFFHTNGIAKNRSLWKISSFIDTQH